MNHQFKPGDPALIIGSNFPGSPNIGKSVELVGFYKPGDNLIAPDGTEAEFCGDQPAWLCEGRGLMARDMNDEWVDHGGITFCNERFLMPLRGDFVPEQQQSREVAA
jgi:hypothetical protein